MARKAGIEWKAVGASLNDLAATMRKLPASTPGAFAYAASGVLQQAGVVFVARYITEADYQGPKGDFLAPPGGTHGPVRRTNKDAQGNYLRNARGQFLYAPDERKLFIKGKFVSRSGEMRATAQELARTAPTEQTGVVLAYGVNPKRDRSGGEIDVSIDAQGRGTITISGGYRSAEMGEKGTVRNGVRGWWRALRSVHGRYATLLKKKYPDLLKPVVGLAK